ncbi:hypothetical protein Pelo_12553 [Pelomyxa schiedti]|nr:hypothetical protein Pelo_12553 [Pelomyxa schiedti]
MGRSKYIIVNTQQNKVVAVSNNLDELKSSEWDYLLRQVPKEFDMSNSKKTWSKLEDHIIALARAEKGKQKSHIRIPKSLRHSDTDAKESLSTTVNTPVIGSIPVNEPDLPEGSDSDSTDAETEKPLTSAKSTSPVLQPSTVTTSTAAISPTLAPTFAYGSTENIPPPITDQSPPLTPTQTPTSTPTLIPASTQPHAVPNPSNFPQTSSPTSMPTLTLSPHQASSPVTSAPNQTSTQLSAAQMQLPTPATTPIPPATQATNPAPLTLPPPVSTPVLQGSTIFSTPESVPSETVIPPPPISKTPVLLDLDKSNTPSILHASIGPPPLTPPIPFTSPTPTLSSSPSNGLNLQSTPPIPIPTATPSTPTTNPTKVLISSTIQTACVTPQSRREKLAEKIHDMMPGHSEERRERREREKEKEKEKEKEREREREKERERATKEKEKKEKEREREREEKERVQREKEEREKEDREKEEKEKEAKKEAQMQQVKTKEKKRSILFDERPVATIDRKHQAVTEVTKHSSKKMFSTITHNAQYKAFIRPTVEAFTSPFPTREQRTRKLLVQVVSVITLICLIVHTCSYGLFIVTTIALNAGAVYLVLHRRQLMTNLARHKIKKFKAARAHAVKSLLTFNRHKPPTAVPSKPNEDEGSSGDENEADKTTTAATTSTTTTTTSAAVVSSPAAKIPHPSSIRKHTQQQTSSQPYKHDSDNDESDYDTSSPEDYESESSSWDSEHSE